ncbi:MAG: hypothetical protein HY334_02250 [Armatimonadetes bacterium]|nr:hypothetical protein [Armatimonadota bacterium]
MSALSRQQAEALLAPVRGSRALYDELRPAYAVLDSLVALLRRRRFSGVILAAGTPGEGAVWFEEGRLQGAWLFPPGADGSTTPPDPLDVLRAFWGDPDAVVAVHPGSPPAPVPSAAAPAPAAPPAVPAALDGDGAATAEAPAAEPPPAAPPPSRRTPTAGSPAARPVLRQISRGRPAAQPPAAAPEAEDTGLGAVPWMRLLPEALARVRRHRGTPLAQRLEEAVNEVLGPAAGVVGKEVQGMIDPGRAAAALRTLADGLGQVTGAAFAERLLWTVGRDFACEDAVKKILATPRPS